MTGDSRGPARWPQRRSRLRQKGVVLLRGRDLVRTLALAGQVAVVLGLWELFSRTSQLGIGFWYAVPVGCCGWWYGKRRGIEMAAGCLAIYLVSAAAADVSMLALGAAVRGAVFAGAALAAGQAREMSLRGQDAASELDAMRQALTPDRLPEIPGLDVAAALLPAEHEVAGDFYLLTNGPGGWSIAIVGDVVGHGPRAAQMATFTRISLISIISGTDDPAEILKLANRAVHTRTRGTGEFVTVVCVAYHPSHASVRWASAGHPLPIALPEGKELEPTHYASPLGFDSELKITSQEVPLAYADAILLYSDGLYEARGHGELFGLDRVMAAVSAPSLPPAAEIIANLRGALLQFADRSLTDDICMVAMRRNPNPTPGSGPQRTLVAAAALPNQAQRRSPDR
jgi:serine phosphatase RsbU (regulator of sigma subunit)